MTIRQRSRRDGQQLVFVTTRANGTADLWTLDVRTHRAKALTSGPGGDFRPSWSPDGPWIAFYVRSRHGPSVLARTLGGAAAHRDLSRSPGRLRACSAADRSAANSAAARSGPPTAAASSRTASPRRRRWTSGRARDRRWLDLARVDRRGHRRRVGCGDRTGRENGAGIRRQRRRLHQERQAGGHRYASGKSGPQGQVLSAAWSPDGRRVAYHKEIARRHAETAIGPKDLEPTALIRSSTGRHAAVVRSERRRYRVGRLHAHARGQSPVRGRRRNAEGDDHLSRGDAKRAGTTVVGERRRDRVRHRPVRRLLQRLPQSVPRQGGSRRWRGADRDDQRQTAPASAN